MKANVWARLESEIRKGLGWTKAIKEILTEMKVEAVGVLWVDDEGAEIVEELSVGDSREMGRWTQTVKEIVIREKVKADG